MNTTLIIMAAGIGSRYGGGIKQLAKVGPSDEIILDYSIHDALEAGFNDVIFIIRRDIEKDFREVIGNRMEKVCPCAYVFQDIHDLPRHMVMPEGRTKPWGTGHAILACKGTLKNPGCIINADDYYGKEAFVQMHDFIVNNMDVNNTECLDIAMPGFILKNTLSDNGSVTRGICEVDTLGHLTDIDETKNIYRDGDGAYKLVDEQRIPLNADAHVSMNMWAITPEFVNRLEDGFADFLEAGNLGDKKAEYLLPTIIGDMIKDGSARVTVLPTNDKWFGVTYAEDRDTVAAEFDRLVSEGVYKTPLF